MTQEIDAQPFVALFKSLLPTLLAVGAVLLGAIAHGLEEIKKNGWKGWLSFFSDLAVCMFVGWIFFHVISIISPDYAVIGSSIGSYWGTKGFVKIRDVFFDTIIKLK